jgi:hypothetical protein
MKQVLAALMLAMPAGTALAQNPYTISAPPVDTGVRQKVSATVVLQAAAGFHVNQAYPTSLQCSPPQDVGLAKSQLTAADGTIDQSQVRFTVIASPLSLGKHVIPCTLRAAVTSASSTDPLAASVQFVVEGK